MANKFDIWVVLGFKDKASEPMKKASKNIEDVGKAFVAVSAAAVVAAVAMKKVFDFGKQGAAIAQTTESFNRLGVSISELRDASLGTVDDMTLMSSTLTLTAGASDALQSQLLANAPQLLLIAKAANKLNPTLGDTASQYESLALGIKRSSPLILDNLGLTIKIGDANETYAKQLGKTVGQLTAEEKQIALLNATIVAGNRLIEQAGGNVEALTDSYAELETNVKNITDAMKVQVSEAIGPFIEGLADGITKTEDYNEVMGEQAVQLALIEQQTTGTTEAFDEFKEAYIRIKAAQEGYAERVGFEAERTQELGDAADFAAEHIDDTALAMQQYNDAIASSDAAAIAAVAQNTQDAADAAGNAASAFNNAAAGISDMSKAAFVADMVAGLKEQMLLAGASAEEWALAEEALLIKLGFLTEEEAGIKQTMDALNSAAGDNKISTQGWADATAILWGNISKMQDRTITVTVNHVDNFREFQLPAQKGEDEKFFAKGGFLPTGQSGIVGDAGMERIVAVPGGVQVTPMTTNNNFHTTVNTRADSGTFLQDIEQAQARAQ